ncbi:DsbA family protein [Zunongwangia sp. H14]|uniref:DsbA family protein n=1 Tax=Zunongwangia sp. H14 TaxID=3240792 RepID=UPI0035660F9B
MAEKFYIEYYTDPLCCWSWGMEPQLRKLRYLFKGRIAYRYIMGGLLRDWQHFEDPMNNISRPAQMGPLWMEAKHSTGQPVEESIWLHNPVDTSYLACMAVKASEMQSHTAGEAMLRELREAVMMKKQNIGDKEVIFDIAGKLQEKNLLDLEVFKKAMHSNQAADLFRKDLEALKIKGITRFPSLLISYGERTVQITGYRPFNVLVDAFKALDPNLEIAENINEEDYINSWEYLTHRELKEIKDLAISRT